MSDFELVSGLIDVGIYVVGIVGGIALFLIGRKRGGGYVQALGVLQSVSSADR